MFKQIISTFGESELDLFASRINHQLSNYISWRPDPGTKVVDAFSINWLPTYNCFPSFSIILKVLQKIQQDKAQPIVVVPYWTTQNWFPVLLGMLMDHPLIMTASLNILYLLTHPTTPYPLNPKLKLLVTHIYIWGNFESTNVSSTTQYIILSSYRKLTRGRYNSVLQQCHDFCGREETNYLLPDVTSVLKFFTKLYENGCQYGSISLALASVVTTLSDHPLIKHFLKRVNDRPIKIKIFF